MASRSPLVAGFTVDAGGNNHKPLVFELSSIAALLLQVKIVQMNLGLCNKSSQ